MGQVSSSASCQKRNEGLFDLKEVNFLESQPLLSRFSLSLLRDCCNLACPATLLPMILPLPHFVYTALALPVSDQSDKAEILIDALKRYPHSWIFNLRARALVEKMSVKEFTEVVRRLSELDEVKQNWLLNLGDSCLKNEEMKDFAQFFDLGSGEYEPFQPLEPVCRLLSSLLASLEVTYTELTSRRMLESTFSTNQFWALVLAILTPCFMVFKAVLHSTSSKKKALLSSAAAVAFLYSSFHVYLRCTPPPSELGNGRWAVRIQPEGKTRLIGRDQKLLDLSRKFDSHLMVTGDEGQGKTVLVEEAARLHGGDRLIYKVLRENGDSGNAFGRKSLVEKLAIMVEHLECRGLLRNRGVLFIVNEFPSGELGAINDFLDNNGRKVRIWGTTTAKHWEDFKNRDRFQNIALEPLLIETIKELQKKYFPFREPINREDITPRSLKTSLRDGEGLSEEQVDLWQAYKGAASNGQAAKFIQLGLKMQSVMALA